MNNMDRMIKLQDVLDGYARDCTKMFLEWQNDFATVMDTNTENILKEKIPKFKEDLLAYKEQILDKQADFPAATVSQPVG